MEWEREFEALIKRGLPLPDPIPNPDDIHVDDRTGTVSIHGPFCPEEKAMWDQNLDRRTAAQKEVNDYAESYSRTRNPRMKDMYLTEWHHEQLMLDILNDAMPERYKVLLQNRSYEDGASRPGKASEIMAEKLRMLNKRARS